jgi:ribosome-associated protein
MTEKRPTPRRKATTAAPAAARPAKTSARASATPRARAKAKAETKARPEAKARVTARAAAAPTRGGAATPRKAAGKAASKARPGLREVVLGALAELKAVDVKALDVRGLTDITDTMVVASGTSDRHVKSLADRVVQRCKEAGFRPYGLEGERDGEWVLLDLQDVVLHVMLPRVREFYALEKLWSGSAAA